ncbi:MAG: tetratricopeptide repeat protein [Spirochaetales bacterium]|nr:tetratricopeptide repeat protein [Spirochaetales bacterium]
MLKKFLLFSFFILFTLFNVFPDKTEDESYLSLHFIPGLSIPIGEKNTGTLSLGGDASLLFRFTVPNLTFLSLEGGAGFGVVPVKLAEDSDYESVMMYLLSPRIGVGVEFEVFPKFFAGAHLHGGYYYGFLDQDMPDNTGQNPLLHAGVGAEFRPVTSLGIGLDVSYRNFLGLYNDIVVSLGTSYHFQSSKRIQVLTDMKPYKELSIKEVALDPIFPVFFKYYDANPIGKMTIKNNGKIPMENVRVKVFINKYMDNPKVCEEIEFLKGDTEYNVLLYALFNESVLSITESTKVQINVVTESTVAGKNYANESVQTIRLYSRNETTWDDDRRAAAFVSLKDPTVLRFSKNVLSMVKNEVSSAMNQNFLAALAFHSALSLYGISYVVDPSTPYEEFSEKKGVVDYLQFPSQTLDYKAGDCDDLSILSCALLESVGIETAFITIPGHIYFAFSLDMPPSRAKREFLSKDDLIYIEDKTWCPIEATALKEGFIQAWKTGAKEWRENNGKNLAALYPVRDAWKIYEAVGITGDPVAITLPTKNAVVESFINQINQFLKMELYPRVTELEEELKRSDSPRIRNTLGILYAKYGIYDKAEEQFLKTLAKEEYLPALVNMGNISFLNKNYKKAKEYYERAYKKGPDNAVILLNLAKVNYELSDYNNVKQYYNKLKKDNKELAEQYSYLDPSMGDELSRASQAEELKEDMIWSE